MIYFDHNSTTPIHPEIKKKIPDWLEIYANPSSSHSAGRQAKDALENARNLILKHLGLSVYKLAFASTGTEANFLALNFLLQDEPEDGMKVLLSSIEHASIHQMKSLLMERGYTVKWIPVDKQGILNLDVFEKECDEDTVLVSVMLANNETGVIQPLQEIRKITDRYGVYLHCNAIQSPTKMKSIFAEIDADSFTFSSHKIYGMKGVSALAYRNKPVPVFKGCDQEKGVRSGTENLLGVLSFELALSEILNREGEYLQLQRKNRDLLEKKIKALDGIVIGEKSPRLANTSLVTLPLQNEKVLIELDKRGFAISKGATRYSGNGETSHVLMSMGVKKELASRTIRVSSGIFTKEKDVNNLVDAIEEILKVRD